MALGLPVYHVIWFFTIQWFIDPFCGCHLDRHCEAFGIDEAPFWDDSSTGVFWKSQNKRGFITHFFKNYFLMVYQGNQFVFHVFPCSTLKKWCFDHGDVSRKMSGNVPPTMLKLAQRKCVAIDKFAVFQLDRRPRGARHDWECCGCWLPKTSHKQLFRKCRP